MAIGFNNNFKFGSKQAKTLEPVPRNIAIWLDIEQLYLQGKTNVEIAETISITENNVALRLNRAGYKRIK